MAKNRLRWVLIGLVVFVVGAGIGKFAFPADSTTNQKPAASASSTATSTVAATDGACTVDKAGVTLVVNFGTKSTTPPIEKCVTGFAGNGWELFAAAGLKVEGTTKYPTGFACRIESLPADQDCGAKASFDKGYWSYFHADATKSKSWTMSEVGAADRKPQSGEFEGWVWVSPEESTVVPSPAASPF